MSGYSSCVRRCMIRPTEEVAVQGIVHVRTFAVCVQMNLRTAQSPGVFQPSLPAQATSLGWSNTMPSFGSFARNVVSPLPLHHHLRTCGVHVGQHGFNEHVHGNLKKLLLCLVDRIGVVGAQKYVVPLAIDPLVVLAVLITDNPGLDRRGPAKDHDLHLGDGSCAHGTPEPVLALSVDHRPQDACVVWSNVSAQYLSA